MKISRLFTSFITIAVFSFLNIQAQEIYTEANAASINNETAANTGWSGSFGTSVTASTTEVFSGTHSIKVEAISDGFRNAFYTFDMEIGTEYTLTFYAKSGGSANQATNPGGFFLWNGFGSFNGLGQDVTSTEWVQYTFNLTAAETTATIRVYTGNPGVTGDVVYIDNISIYPTNNPPANNTTSSSFWDAAGNNISYTNGNVGIGTANPDAALAVKGQVHSQEVKVDLLGALVPDYVFTDNYKLLSLEEVAAYIQKENHLPNIPSAKEIEKEGLLLKEMNLKLLEKIEELTLYTLQQQKQLQAQDVKNKMLEEAIKNLQKTIDKLLK